MKSCIKLQQNQNISKVSKDFYYKNTKSFLSHQEFNICIDCDTDVVKLLPFEYLCNS